uniref:SMP-30/Gluconolactonase/LRE-like region domain-containing protein n=1 Tax=Chromera velia CCMP2878 TaxID=1169474 RepID=A0A0G4H717_9ALVE|eukprot:Cvel_24957.t1-p1 / transcript=Cvel_24957.t1 / gene=Cvel_24957 / organism=Chromera_velia_CCMP2878 / gene_product=E3 ubiquitin-protein ligase TRIM71, putative / transcript_product=E3 ubiquitin-protein ligase TRIM71, putative / location=Cvel_scaffold2763:18247-21408(-) / protein_length=339 / sequence_SO=supercontig / SO=protein_coding / is_pseudo=false
MSVHHLSAFSRTPVKTSGFFSVGTEAHFSSPAGLVVDGSGNVIVADTKNHRIRKIGPDGRVSTLAGGGTAGFVDGQGAQARFHNPTGVVVDGSGNVIVADSLNHRIRKITPDGTVSTLAGNGTVGFVDGQSTEAQFSKPIDVAVDRDGYFIVTGNISQRIWKISPEGNVSTLAGGGRTGFADGQGRGAQFCFPVGVAVDLEGYSIVADYANNRIRKISPEGNVSTLAGGGTAGFVDGQSAQALFDHPTGVVVDRSGNVIVADSSNYRIRMITPDGTVSTLAGNGTEGFVDGQGTEAQFKWPRGVAVDSDGNVVVTDLQNHRIRKVAAGLTPPSTPVVRA